MMLLVELIPLPGIWNPIVDIGLTLIALVIVWYLARRYLDGKPFIVLIALLILSQSIASLFGFTIFASLLQLVSFSIVAAFAVIYSQELRRRLVSKRSKGGYFGVIDIADKDIFFKEINEAVLTLSATKTGALITFEKKDSLEHYIQAGEPVDAPLSSELLRTIFYPGTPLHDGAVIIRGMTIIAASVYYSPTLKALRGKFGARHRAALGISEITDAITVVVSEETGRISIAKNGEIIVINRDNFAEVLAENLSQG
ncbi:MAG: diadenylate cyclase [Bacilli bacterium]